MISNIVVQQFEDRLLADAEKMAVVCSVRQKINDGYYDGYIDYFYQNNWRRSEKVVDTYLFAQLHSMIQLGWIAMCDIETGITPSPDAIGTTVISPYLKNMGAPFSGEFWGGTQGADGVLRWDSDIIFGACGSAKNGQTTIADQRITVPANIAVLEMGTTSAVKTYTQILHGRLLARWPYNATTIKIFYFRPEFTDKVDIYVPSFPEEVKL